MRLQPRDKAFASQMLVCALGLIVFAGVSGVGVIAQRVAINQTADRIKALENALANIRRHQTEIGSRIAAEQTLDTLIRRNTTFNLGLAPAREHQIVRTNIDVRERLARKRGAGASAATLPETIAAPANPQLIRISLTR